MEQVRRRGGGRRVVSGVATFSKYLWMRHSMALLDYSAGRFYKYNEYNFSKWFVFVFFYSIFGCSTDDLYVYHKYDTTTISFSSLLYPYHTLYLKPSLHIFIFLILQFSISLDFLISKLGQKNISNTVIEKIWSAYIN